MHIFLLLVRNETSYVKILVTNQVERPRRGKVGNLSVESHKLPLFSTRLTQSLMLLFLNTSCNLFFFNVNVYCFEFGIIPKRTI